MEATIIRRAQVVSPPFACGVAWLINALLELDVKVTNFIYKTNNWEQKDNAWRMGESALEYFKWHLPVLHDREHFFFPENIEIFWEHRLDFAGHGTFPTIVFVRDPRDAIYSLWRRYHEKEMGFITYLQMPNPWPYHLLGLFELPPFETYAYFVFYWLAMEKCMPVKLVRFEDTKLNPYKELSEVLDFINVSRSSEQINKAVESSAFNRAKDVMRKMTDTTGKDFVTARKGLVGEWKTTYSKSALRYCNGPAELLLRELNYSTGRRQSGWVFDDCRQQSLRKMPRNIRSAVLQWLEDYQNGKVVSPEEILQLIELKNLVGKDLLMLGSVVQAMHYVTSIFADRSSAQARVAMNVFVNLNLHYCKLWPIQVAAKFALERIEASVGRSFSNRLGYFWRWRYMRMKARFKPSEPILLGGVADFNVVLFNRHYFAIQRAAGHVDFAKPEEANLGRFFSGKWLLIVVAKGLMRAMLSKASSH